MADCPTIIRSAQHAFRDPVCEWRRPAEDRSRLPFSPQHSSSNGRLLLDTFGENGDSGRVPWVCMECMELYGLECMHTMYC